MYQGYWQTTIGVELKGKILGLLGLGKVGSQVAKIGKAFGMQVMAWSENLNLDTCKKLDVLPCSKEDLIKNSDFLSIHVQGGERYKDCITLKEMEPYYDKAEDKIGVTRTNGIPGLPGNNNFKVFYDGAKKMGYQDFETYGFNPKTKEIYGRQRYRLHIC